MRKLLVITLVASLLAATIPGMAFAGDRRGGRSVLPGVAIGATIAILGGALLGALSAPPAVYAEPPVVYAPHPHAAYAPPPPVIYAPPPAVVYVPAPPVVYYSAPPPIYRRAPARVYRHWEPRDRLPRWHREYRGGRDRY